MAIGPIPWSAVMSWCARHGVDDADEMWEIICVVDQRYRDLLDKRSERKAKTTTASPPPPARPSAPARGRRR
jgi:hypothetical protein